MSANEVARYKPKLALEFCGSGRMHLPRSQKAVELLNQLSAARVLDEDTSRIDIVSHSEDVDVSPAASFVVVPDSEKLVFFW